MYFGMPEQYDFGQSLQQRSFIKLYHPLPFKLRHKIFHAEKVYHDKCGMK